VYIVVADSSFWFEKINRSGGGQEREYTNRSHIAAIVCFHSSASRPGAADDFSNYFFDLSTDAKQSSVQMRGDSLQSAPHGANENQQESEAKEEEGNEDDTKRESTKKRRAKSKKNRKKGKKSKKNQEEANKNTKGKKKIDKMSTFSIFQEVTK